MLLSILVPIAAGDQAMWKLFVDCSTYTQTVAVISLVKPWDVTKFLTHVCLSLGRYQTEIDLFNTGNMRQAFVTAGLLPSSGVVTRSEVLDIVRRYVVEDLAYHPILARQFAAYLSAAISTLYNAHTMLSWMAFMPNALHVCQT